MTFDSFIFGLVLGILAANVSDALYCLQKPFNEEEATKVLCYQAGSEYTGCYSYTHTRIVGGQPDGTSVEQGCQVIGLECLRDEVSLSKWGITSAGNCFNGRYSAKWDGMLRKCEGERRKLHQNSDTITSNGILINYCTCNDGDLCNENCVCDSNNGLCGAGGGCPIQLPTATHKCYCQTDGSAEPKGIYQCVDGQRKCFGDGDNRGCYVISKQRQSQVRKDCVANLTALQCIFGQLKSVPGRGGYTCVTGTNADWKVVSRKCGGDPSSIDNPQDVEHPGDRLKAYYCTGEMCNKENIAWNEDDPKINWSDRKNDCGSEDQGRFALGVAILGMCLF